MPRAKYSTSRWRVTTTGISQKSPPVIPEIVRIDPPRVTPRTWSRGDGSRSERDSEARDYHLFQRCNHGFLYNINVIRAINGKMPKNPKSLPHQCSENLHAKVISRFDRLLMIDATASSYASIRDELLLLNLWHTFREQLHRQMPRFDVWAAPWIFASEMESVAVAVKVDCDVCEWNQSRGIYKEYRLQK